MDKMVRGIGRLHDDIQRILQESGIRIGDDDLVAVCYIASQKRVISQDAMTEVGACRSIIAFVEDPLVPGIDGCSRGAIQFVDRPWTSEKARSAFIRAHASVAHLSFAEQVDASHMGRLINVHMPFKSQSTDRSLSVIHEEREVAGMIMRDGIPAWHVSQCAFPIALYGNRFPSVFPLQGPCELTMYPGDMLMISQTSGTDLTARMRSFQQDMARTLRTSGDLLRLAKTIQVTIIQAAT